MHSWRFVPRLRVSHPSPLRGATIAIRPRYRAHHPNSSVRFDPSGTPSPSALFPLPPTWSAAPPARGAPPAAGGNGCGGPDDIGNASACAIAVAAAATSESTVAAAVGAAVGAAAWEAPVSSPSWWWSSRPVALIVRLPCWVVLRVCERAMPKSCTREVPTQA